MKNFRGAWYAVCKLAGLGKFVEVNDKKTRWEGLIFHDLRRTGARNLRRLGVSEGVIMQIGGWRTRMSSIVTTSSIRQTSPTLHGASTKNWKIGRSATVRPQLRRKRSETMRPRMYNRLQHQ